MQCCDCLYFELHDSEVFGNTISIYKGRWTSILMMVIIQSFVIMHTMPWPPLFWVTWFRSVGNTRSIYKGRWTSILMVIIQSFRFSCCVFDLVWVFYHVYFMLKNAFVLWGFFCAKRRTNIDIRIHTLTLMHINTSTHTLH
jgi:predicted membrane protein